MCKRKRGQFPTAKYYNFSRFSGPRDRSYIVFFAEELGKISLKLSEGHNTTPALTLIGSCMTFRAL